MIALFCNAHLKMIEIKRLKNRAIFNTFFNKSLFKKIIVKQKSSLSFSIVLILSQSRYRELMKTLEEEWKKRSRENIMLYGTTHMIVWCIAIKCHNFQKNWEKLDDFLVWSLHQIFTNAAEEKGQRENESVRTYRGNSSQNSSFSGSCPRRSTAEVDT